MILVLGIVVLGICGINMRDPSLRLKSEVLNAIQIHAPPQYDAYAHGSIIKPDAGTSGSAGVGRETHAWTLALCETVTRGPCMRQPRHPGPIEVRLVKSGAWETPVCFIAGWESKTDDAPAWECDPPWRTDVQRAVDAALHEPCVSVDVRADSDSFLILEVNGVWGIGYDWVLGHAPWRWVVSRIVLGVCALVLHPLRCARSARDFARKIQSRRSLARHWQFETL